MEIKKNGLVVLLAMLGTLSISEYGFGQKIGYFDTDKVLAALEETKNVETQLQNIQEQWIVEGEALQDTLRQMYDDYKNIQSSVIVSKSTKDGMLKNIQELEQHIMDFQNQKFGQSGEIYGKQQELMQPLIDKVLEATQLVLKEKKYDLVLDKSQVFSGSEEYDLTKVILAKLKEIGMKMVVEKQPVKDEKSGAKEKKTPKN